MFTTNINTISIPATRYGKTVADLLSEIQQHMLEPIIDSGKTWQLWSETEVLHYLRERCSRLLLETGIIQYIEQLEVFPNTNTYTLPQTVAELSRIAFSGSVLFPIDDWQIDAIDLTQYVAPQFYQSPTTEQNTIELIPTPNVSGNLTYQFTKSTPLESPTELSTEDAIFQNYLLPIPFILTWAIKYGVMADMLSSVGEAQDLERAEVFEQRYQDGIDLIKLFCGVS